MGIPVESTTGFPVRNRVRAAFKFSSERGQRHLFGEQCVTIEQEVYLCRPSS